MCVCALVWVTTVVLDSESGLLLATRLGETLYLCALGNRHAIGTVLQFPRGENHWRRAGVQDSRSIQICGTYRIRTARTYTTPGGGVEARKQGAKQFTVVWVVQFPVRCFCPVWQGKVPPGNAKFCNLIHLIRQTFGESVKTKCRKPFSPK